MSGMSQAQDDSARLDAIRERVLVGLESALRDRLFTDLTVADIVAAAGMSKRSFYEVFPHKNACLLWHAQRHNDRVIDDIEHRLLSAPDKLAGARLAVEGFFGPLRDHPGVARAHLIETYGLGADGLVIRQSIKARYAEMLQRAAMADDGTEVVELDDISAAGLVGAFNDMAIQAVVDDFVDYEKTLDTAVDFIRAMFVGMWVEKHWGPIDLRRFARTASDA